MKKKISAIIIPLVITMLLGTGCAKVPQAEIDAANAAIEEARQAGADLYLSEQYIALEDSLSAVLVRMESMESRLIKNYSGAKEELAAVTLFAGEVKMQTEQRKEALKSEILATISEVRSLIESNRQLITEAPRGKEGTSALTAIKGELNSIEQSIEDATTMLEQGDYLGIQEKANAAKTRAESINSELTEVIATYKANSRSRIG